MPGIIERTPFRGPIFRSIRKLREEVVERELAREHLLLEARLLVHLDGRLGLLDQRQHVAHAEDARGHPVGVEVLELVELLADRRELHRLARDRAHRESGTAARVAVELREDDAVERDALVEGLRDGNGFLARHRVEHEQDVRGLGRLAHGRELLHQRLVDVQPPGRVEDDDVATLLLRLLDALGDGLNGVRPREDGDLQLLPELLELIDGRRPLQVGGDEGRRMPFLAEEQRELGGRSRLARALEAGEQDHGRRPPGEGDLGASAPHQVGQLVVDDLHDLLARGEALRQLQAERARLHARHEVLDDLEVDVRLEQRETDLAHRFRDRFLVELAAPADLAESALEPV